MWPAKSTDFIDIDDDSKFMPGQLGIIKNDLTPNEKDLTKKKY